MKRRNNRIMFMVLLALGIVFFYSMKAYAAPQNTMPIPKINISVDNANNPTEYVDNIKLLIMLTVLTLLPSFIVMMTSFVRTIVVFGFLRNAMGTQQSPPNQVMIGLALFLTLFIMQPVYSEINTKAIQPYMKNKITQEQAVEIGAKPLRQFMLKQTRQKDLKLFVDLAKPNFKVTKDNAPLYIVVPAFIISELKTAFQIGFLLFIPFLIIDLVVASVLMSMGMFMLPPVMISLPFKLLLFVMVDGWYLLVKSLVMSFG
ncbi:flagellar biosynthetic protein FliP [Clostridium sporogenes]|uniref:Flagellar biosynthetic protein FliP n=2 Tax=Clostridium TaxID=1485 RepID=A0ABC8CNP5_CLOBO|nr:MULTISPECIES: flagellar type III secretion system pore protein FliP [Clostridium]AVQ37285.1 flagellar biosynthetic protein FliP [Clostridium botulinum]AVQ44350.1 flagellar biosynthetic protein FliP [Clostridium botulinum]AVQ47893.1 flagellar biosynthetic protein FliP [Clostridium botulinum]MBU5299873.1 flagellar type III secretion system pore protein FliP [Clostridium sporogenes]NFP91551.1 flagellar type III secretion system pore protein FliP [Clostridium sporogenes]